MGRFLGQKKVVEKRRTPEQFGEPAPIADPLSQFVRQAVEVDAVPRKSNRVLDWLPGQKIVGEQRTRVGRNNLLPQEMSLVDGESQRGFFKQPIRLGRKRRVPVRWPVNVDLFSFVTGKRFNLPVEATDVSPVVAQSALVSAKVKDTQPVQ